ncbi:hypothetical protein [Herbidospora mongoliensis]|uniref:hypothetical protein n=1 Tax=Herbidospora mongoliensis TaxID=688067 RepID=UPI000832A702|nr:hypothetical protein [Herbidospora mongoliensis]
MPETTPYRDSLLGVQSNFGRTRPVRRETRDGNGRIRREVSRPTDAGSDVTVTNRTDRRGREHQDVHVEAAVIVQEAS